MRTRNHGGWIRPAMLALSVCLAWACGGGESGGPPPTDRLPADFQEEELRALVENLDVIKTVENEVELEVLKWKVEENDQPQRVTSALIWAHFRAGDRDDWMLAHVIRASGPDGPTSPWSLAVFRGTPQVSHEYYQQPPGPEEVARFQRATWWSDDPTAGNRLADSAVRSAAWTAAIGSPPPATGG